MKPGFTPIRLALIALGLLCIAVACALAPTLVDILGPRPWIAPEVRVGLPIFVTWAAACAAFFVGLAYADATRKQ